MFDVHWGLPVILYLFLAGVGAGALTVSSSVLLRGGGGGFAGDHFKVARYGALLAPLPLMVGTGLIILELGTFEAAIEHGEWGLLFRWINLFLTINLSPMSIGSWVLAACILASLAYAWTFLKKDAGVDDGMAGMRKALAWIGVPLGIAVAVYTGILLGAMPARPFWNSPILAMLFLLSALSSGVAGILLLRAIFHRGGQKTSGDAPVGRAAYILSASDAMLIGFEVLVVFLFIMFAHLTIGSQAQAISAILPGGELAGLFWFGVVVFGLLLPVLVELRYVIPTLLNHEPYRIPVGMEIGVSALVLLGGFMLRYVVVIAGQITGPVGM
jgi:formate-dependent nitrite reductase membrane component NrfD